MFICLYCLNRANPDDLNIHMFAFLHCCFRIFTRFLYMGLFIYLGIYIFWTHSTCCKLVCIRIVFSYCFGCDLIEFGQFILCRTCVFSLIVIDELVEERKVVLLLLTYGKLMKSCLRNVLSVVFVTVSCWFLYWLLCFLFEEELDTLCIHWWPQASPRGWGAYMS